MKKLTNLFTLVCLCIATSGFAQIDVKIAPLGLLFGGLDLGAEFCLTENIGVEPLVSFNNNKSTIGGEEIKFTGIGIRGFGKYYFSPKNGTDRFYAGPYVKWRNTSGSSSIDDSKFTRNRLALGLALGYKVVANSGLIFEFAIGGGRALLDEYKDSNDNDVSIGDITNADLTSRLAIGYRFGGSSSGSSKRR